MAAAQSDKSSESDDVDSLASYSDNEEQDNMPNVAPPVLHIDGASLFDSDSHSSGSDSELHGFEI